MRRFKFYHEFQSRCDCCMEESSDGEYISYEDHINEIAKFQFAIHAMERRCEELKTALIRANERS